MLQWKRIDVIFFFFLVLYIIHLLIEVSTAFPLLNEVFFLNASTDCKLASGSGTFTYLLATVTNLNPAA